MSRPKCTSLACHKKNLDGSAHGYVVWRGRPTSIKIQVCQRSSGSPEARSDLLVNWNAAKLHSPNFNVTWMSRCSGSRDVICKGQMSTGERGRVIALVSCRASVVGLKTFAGWHSRTTDKESRDSRQTHGLLHPSTARLGAARELLRRATRLLDRSASFGVVLGSKDSGDWNREMVQPD